VLTPGYVQRVHSEEMRSTSFWKAAVSVLSLAILAISTGVMGCTPETSADGNGEGDTATTPLSSANGLSMINGLSLTNGLSSLNGLSMLNGLASVSGVANGVGLMTSASGRTTLAYLVRCALPAGRTIIKKDQNNVSYSFAGQIGVAPEWETGACDATCMEEVSACMLAHVNTTGQHIAIWLDGDSPAIGWGQNSNYPFQEGSFFGNLFVSPPHAYFCNGKDFDRGVVPGRLGATQVGAPYVNGLATFNGTGNLDTLCSSGAWWDCARATAPHDTDGFAKCSTYTHVVTVWRDFDPSTLYKISNKLSGKVLDGGAVVYDGAPVKQKTYVSSNAQKWRILSTSPGRYNVINAASGKSLEIAGQTTTDGTALILATPSGQSSQLFGFTSLGDGTGYLKIAPASSSNVSLSPPPGSFKVDGAMIQEWSWTVSDQQEWQVLIAN